MYQHDPRRVDVLVKGTAVEHTNTGRTPADVTLREHSEREPEQFSKDRCHVARCLFLSQARAEITYTVNECQTPRIRAW